VLLSDRQAEALKQDQKDKEVVDGERALEHVARYEFECALPSLRVPLKGGEAKSQRDEEKSPEERAAKARALRSAAEHDKVDRQQQQNDRVKANPVANGCAGDHGLPFLPHAVTREDKAVSGGSVL